MSAAPPTCARTKALGALDRSELSLEQRAHVDGCAACSAEIDATEEMLAMARSLETSSPDPSRSERVRLRLLGQARARFPAAPAPRARAALAAFLAAAVVVLGLVLLPRLTDPHASSDGAVGAREDTHMRGTVRASTGAHFTRLSDAPDEIVRLVEGGISVSVSPLAPGERFRVVIGDAEVEVRGTAFDVTAEDDHLTRVRVLHGLVEVRVSGLAPVLLGAGEEWTRALPEREDEGAPAVTARVIEDAIATGAAPSTARHRRGSAVGSVDEAEAIAARERSTPSVDAPVDAEAMAFERGWSSLRAGDPASAAVSFAEVADASPRHALAEDASFWRSVALSRAGNAAEARVALSEFLSTYPDSPRGGTAAVMLGWLLVESGQPTLARERFERAASDDDERVRASAERGLLRLADPTEGAATAP